MYIQKNLKIYDNYGISFTIIRQNYHWLRLGLDIGYNITRKSIPQNFCIVLEFLFWSFEFEIHNRIDF